MRFITFAEGGEQRLGISLGGAADDVVDLSVAAPDLPPDLAGLIAGGPELLERARQVAEGTVVRRKAADLKLLAPIPAPLRNVFCVGKNYYEHAEEFHSSGYDASAGKDAVPEVPIVFTKATTGVSGPGDPIPLALDPTGSTDYEGELTVVIGPGGRGIAKADALKHVFGYTIINDVTARTLQQRYKQWFLGKSIDGFCPMGPCVVTADEIPDPAALRLTTRVNGEVRQDAPVSSLIFDIPTLIETISARITLLPGDLIATGTPAGVGLGFDPPRFLKAGDEVAITIEPIGTLTNRAE